MCAVLRPFSVPRHMECQHRYYVAWDVTLENNSRPHREQELCSVSLTQTYHSARGIV